MKNKTVQSILETLKLSVGSKNWIDALSIDYYQLDFNNGPVIPLTTVQVMGYIIPCFEYGGYSTEKLIDRAGSSIRYSIKNIHGIVSYAIDTVIVQSICTTKRSITTALYCGNNIDLTTLNMPLHTLALMLDRPDHFEVSGWTIEYKG